MAETSKTAVFDGLARAQACLAVQTVSLAELEDRALGAALALLAIAAQDELRTVERAASDLLGAEHD